MIFKYVSHKFSPMIFPKIVTLDLASIHPGKNVVKFSDLPKPFQMRISFAKTNNKIRQ